MTRAETHRQAGRVVAWIRSHASGAGHLRIDSRETVPGDVFLALPGRRDDGRRYVADAVARGAAAVVAEHQGSDPPPCGVPMLPVENLVPMLGEIGAIFYREPTAQLLMIGVTGTNGKTSCSHWIAQVLSACGRRCAVIGTVGSGFTDALLADASLTTPDAIGLQRQARALADAGAQALAMEVSSIGLDQGRADAIEFDLALFTNLTRDHLDYHGSMAEYERAKARLFEVPSLAHAVLNLDDAFGRQLAQRCRARALRTTGYRVQPGTQPGTDDTPVDVSLIGASLALGAGDIRLDARLRRAGASEHTVPVQAPVLGRFNVSNVLGVLGIALAAGIDAGDAARAMQGLRPPPGRLQRVEIEAGSPGAATADLPLVLIDYAHTPDAIEQALAALRPVAQARSGRLWIVFGAGGDRDPGKRPQMGAAAVHGADQVVVTSDNPRSEVPGRIISQILAGAGDAGTRLSHVEDRTLAIGHAVAQADAADVVLIAGKGHEQYQEMAGRRLAFSDLQCARQALQRRAEGARAGASR
ncbi:MAG TPA: UDP-N-acetylmuramoyl-L-alanyl-D-glutamate--2,6-diaminopimelate ligase [Burkholderiaceae bacterium]|nr:UDP-N-acetylmuramoyl-L-alanyl-D-glutamate--2,6-diaminopimelate ligase [Burkholderiaceae bacterium]